MTKLMDFQNLIARSGWKPYLLSIELGHNPATVYHWLSGKYEPNCKDILKLARYLNVPVERIVRIFAER